MKTKHIKAEAFLFVDNAVKHFTPHFEYALPSDEEQCAKDFIGTVFGIMPSGKFYTPWACSNLKPCPNCGGACNVPNPHASRKAYIRTERLSWSLRRQAITRFKEFFQGEWPRGLLSRLELLDHRSKRFHPNMACPHCDGMGSREAAIDEAFREAMTERATELGFWLESGEGDPCDLFLCRNLTDEEAAKLNEEKE